MFWHKLLQRAFVEHARVFIHGILRIPQGSLVARYMTMLVVFFISATMHIVSLRISIRCAGPHLVAYYCGIAIVIALENLIDELYKRYLRGGEQKGSDKRDRYWQAMGYIWVAFFHIWTTPKFVYPIIFCPYQSEPLKIVERA